jgi:hypothetical protein
MIIIRVGRRHIFYRALDLLTSCAYRDLMTFINEGNALTLDEVLKAGLKYSRDRPSTASAFSAPRRQPSWKPPPQHSRFPYRS